jgi:hypothetical protein
MVNPGVFDKDGISAIGVFAEWTNYIYGNRQTLSSYLTMLNDKYGYFASSNSYFICNEPATIKKIFGDMRPYPKEIAGLRVKWIRDLTTAHAYDSSTPDQRPILPTSSSPMITFRYAKK